MNQLRKFWNISRDYSLLVMVIGLLACAFWKHSPSISTALTFWIPWLYWNALWIVRNGVWKYRWCRIGVSIGGILNAAAILANGGFMPVTGEMKTREVWIQATPNTHLFYLCDIHGGASVGDFIILGSAFVALNILAASLLHWFLNRPKRNPIYAFDGEATFIEVRFK